MSKHQFANEKVMKNYITALLTEEEKEAPKKDMAPVADLLKQVQIVEQTEKYQDDIKEVTNLADETGRVEDVVLQSEESSQHLVSKTEKEYRQGSFQALFFKVAGLTVAVPLTELGGIHNLSKLNTLLGKPGWFMGVMVHREEKLSVVDTAKWVMPEKYDESLAESLDYQYLIMLNDSNWGLACEELVNTVTLEQDDVKWMDSSVKRPWLAGLIKDRMCALLDVEALTVLLNNGLDISNEEL